MRISTRWKLSTLIIANFMVTASVCANQETPGVFIEREFDRSNAMVPGLQSQYRVCSDQRELYRKIYLQGGVGWQAIKQTLPEGYNIKEATLPEPNWRQERVGINVEREYFFGNKYAHYQTQYRYEISDKDQCALIKHQDLKIELDDGSDRHLITLRDKVNIQETPDAGGVPLAKQYRSNKVDRHKSTVSARVDNNKALDKIGKEEKVARLLSLLYADTQGSSAPASELSIDKDLTKNVHDAIGYKEDKATQVTVPRANDEHYIAGQPCDIIEAKDLKARLWYWSKMHYYPGVMERPILLKTEVRGANGKSMGTKEAKVFRIMPSIDDKVFTPDL